MRAHVCNRVSGRARFPAPRARALTGRATNLPRQRPQPSRTNDRCRHRLCGSWVWWPAEIRTMRVRDLSSPRPARVELTRPARIWETCSERAKVGRRTIRVPGSFSLSRARREKPAPVAASRWVKCLTKAKACPRTRHEHGSFSPERADLDLAWRAPDKNQRVLVPRSAGVGQD